MGGYYARHDGEDAAVADAIRDHYAPKGAGRRRARPAPVTIAVALADKLDQLAGFFAIGEKPTGSGDPYALRRAALGVIRIVRDNAACARPAADLIRAAADVLSRMLPASDTDTVTAEDASRFSPNACASRLRADGARHDVLAAVFASADDDDLLRSGAHAGRGRSSRHRGWRTICSPAYRRAANILRIEEQKDGPHDGAPDAALAATSRRAGALYGTATERRRLSDFLRRGTVQRRDVASCHASCAARRFLRQVTVNAPSRTSAAIVCACLPAFAWP